MRRVDQRDVRERLGEVAEHAACDRVVLLREKSDVVAQAEQSREYLLRLVAPSKQDQIVDKPEAASEESAFAASQAVFRASSVVAPDEAVHHEIALNGLDRRLDAWIGGRKEPYQWDEKGAGVEVR